MEVLFWITMLIAAPAAITAAAAMIAGRERVNAVLEDAAPRGRQIGAKRPDEFLAPKELPGCAVAGN